MIIDENILNYPTNEFLKKLGKGKHIPGSGSAAAFYGMISAQLIVTVTKITTRDKMIDEYGEWFDELRKITIEIEERIYPLLEELFEKDSIQFDKAIKLRNARIREKNPIKKNKLSKEATEALIPAIEIPINIAKLCIELADFASFTFDNGYKSVRGDSGVALNGALSGLGGCLSIINLNLLSFSNDDFTEKVREQTKELTENYNRLAIETKNRLKAIEEEANQIEKYYSKLNEIRKEYTLKQNLTYDEIEQITRKLQNIQWEYRKVIWKKNTPQAHLEILKPTDVLKKLGYDFYLVQALGQITFNGKLFETAGIIDKKNKTVNISDQLPPDVKNFTIAHELGHAFLHKKLILHRDIPLDGSEIKGPRSREEKEADKFASFFLMPEKLVKKAFYDRFSTSKIFLNEDFIFGLKSSSFYTVTDQFKNLRDFSRLVATIDKYNSVSFTSIAKEFGVSTEAMAIRLEELGLVEF